MFLIKQLDTPEEMNQLEHLLSNYTRWVKENLLRIGVLKDGTPEYDQFNKEDVMATYTKGRSFILLAKKEDEVVACSMVKELDDCYCEIKRLYVKPDYRGKKLGINLLDELIFRARAAGFGYIRISTYTSFMAQAVNMYRELGFYQIEDYNEDPLQAGDIQMECALIPKGNGRGFKLITSSGEEIDFDYYLEDAPDTAQAFDACLPLEIDLYHAKTSGEEIWSPKGPALQIPQENASIFMEEGEMVLGPLHKRNKIAQCLGIMYGKGKLLDCGNIFARVQYKDRDLLRRLGHELWIEGSKKLKFVKRYTGKQEGQKMTIANS